VWPAASGGARPAMARTGEERERGGHRMGVPGGAGWRPDRDKAMARPRRRRTAATWPAPGGARRAPARGREGRAKRAVQLGWAEREAGLPPFLFFNFFSPKSLNKIFEAFAKLFRGWGKKKNCYPQNSLQLCFNKQIQIPNRI